MPALNIIATQETVRNSGASSSRPSGIRPYLLAASHSTYSTKPEASVTNSQPRLASIQVSAVELALPRFVGAAKPQATKATATTAATPKTTRSSPPRSACGTGGSASAGCASVIFCSLAVTSAGRGSPYGGLLTGGCGALTRAPLPSSCLHGRGRRPRRWRWRAGPPRCARCRSGANRVDQDPITDRDYGCHLRCTAGVQRRTPEGA